MEDQPQVVIGVQPYTAPWKQGERVRRAVKRGREEKKGKNGDDPQQLQEWGMPGNGVPGERRGES